MKRLQPSNLERGDIILTTTTASVSKAIRAGTKSDISHAMIYMQHCSVIDATSEGVQARNTQRMFFEDECALHVFRLKAGLTSEQVEQICQFVRQKVGSEYSVREAIRTVIGGSDQWTRKQFCSRLVAQAYASAGIALVDDANYCAPADLAKSLLLAPVQDAAETTTEEEARRWASHSDSTQSMRNTINTVLDGVRKKDKSIQTFEDIILYLMKHPEDDGYVAELLMSSGYLTVWQHDLDKSAWQYEDALLAEVPLKECEDYCRGTLMNEQAGPHRYVLNRGTFWGLFQQFRLSSFKLLFDLFDFLAAQHRQRVAVARRWLESNKLIAPVLDIVVVPHSAEWFEALRLWDPVKAAQTRVVVGVSGRDDVCSVCGDDPAGDYRLEKAFRAAGGVDTLRLCEDCVDIRRAMGEPYEVLQLLHPFP